ncbi:MAG: hypothetical protein R8J85_00545 [Mariprofundales bacterium]
MKVNANLQAMSNITTTQQVSANNVANMLTNGFKASRVQQMGDTITISQETRNAIQKNEAASASSAPSTSNIEQDLLQMRNNEVALSANVTAIKTQSEIYKALNALK